MHMPCPARRRPPANCGIFLTTHAHFPVQGANPVAQSLYSLLDHHAGLVVPQTLPPVFYAAEQPGAGGQPPSYHQHAHPMQQPGLGGPPAMIPVQAADLSYPAAGAPLQQHADADAAQPRRQGRRQEQEQQGGQHTPSRHAQRKGAPRKRRRLEEAFELQQQAQQAQQLGSYAGLGQQAAQQQHEHVLPIVGPPVGVVPAAAGGSGGALGGLTASDLLNMPLDEEGLLSLLCDDDLQVRQLQGGWDARTRGPFVTRGWAVHLVWPGPGCHAGAEGWHGLLCGCCQALDLSDVAGCRPKLAARHRDKLLAGCLCCRCGLHRGWRSTSPPPSTTRCQQAAAQVRRLAFCLLSGMQRLQSQA